MLSFRRYLSEALHDVRWYENLPDLTPPTKIRALERQLGITGKVKWKRLTDPRMSSRAVASLDLVAMSDRDADNILVWYHELGHITYRLVKREWADNLTNYVRAKFKKKVPGWYKAISIGGETHAISHSGSSAQNDEVWATLCRLYWSGSTVDEDPSIRQAMDMIFKGR